MATIWIDILDMGGFGSKMERDAQLGGMEAPPIKNNSSRINGAKASRLPGNINLEANQSNSPKTNNSSKATPNLLSNNNYGRNVEAGLNLNTSVAATNNSNSNSISNSRRQSNVNLIDAEVEAIEINTEQAGGKRKSKARKTHKARKTRKARKARKARKTRRTKH